MSQQNKPVSLLGKGKRGAGDWTVAKLLSVILALVLLVLLVYGFSTGGLIPLKDKLEAKMNSVTLMVNSLMGTEDKESQGIVDCNSPRSLVGFPGSEDLIGAFDLIGGINYENAVVKVCKTYCEISGVESTNEWIVRTGWALKPYNKFYLEGNEKSLDDYYFLSGDSEELLTELIIWNQTKNLISKEVINAYIGDTTTALSIYNLEKGIYAVWVNGVWNIYSDEESGLQLIEKEFTTGNAIDYLYTVSNGKGWFDLEDKLYYSRFSFNVLDLTATNIKYFGGSNIGYFSSFGGDGTLEESRIGYLTNLLEKEERELANGIYNSPDSLEKIKTLEDKKIIVGKNELTIEIIENLEDFIGPVIKIDNPSGKNYFLVYSPSEGSEMPFRFFEESRDSYVLADESEVYLRDFDFWFSPKYIDTHAKNYLKTVCDFN